MVDPLMVGDNVSLVPVQIFDNKNFGFEKVLSASGLVINDGNDGNNYAVSYVDDSTGNIDQLAINVTAVTDNKAYDGTTSSDGVPVVDALMVGDDVSLVPIQVFDNKHFGTEKILLASGLVIDDGNDGNNYAVSYVPVATGNINQLAINVTAVTDSKTYDGTISSDEVPVADLLRTGDVVSLNPVQVFDNKNFGSGKTLLASGLVINDGNEGNNYAVSYVPVATGNINQLAINVTAVTDSKTYDGTISSDEVPVADLLRTGDVVSLNPVQVFDNKNFGSGKTLLASGLVINDGNEGNNYDVSYVNDLTGFISTLSFDVTAVTDSKTYDGTPSSDGVPVVDLLKNGDVVTGNPVQVFDNKNIGSGKTLSASGLEINDGNDGNNYAISYVPVATGNIDQLDIDVTAVTDSKTYDGSSSSDGVPVVDPLMIGDVVSGIPAQVFDNKNAGSGKSLIASGVVINDGNGGSNYAVSYVNATTGSISTLAIDVTAVTDSKTYDGTIISDEVPVVDLLMNGDIVGENPVQVFDSKHVGSVKTLSASGLVISDGNGGNNYAVSYLDVSTGNIDQLPINVRAVSDSKVYDGFTSSLVGPSVDPLMVGDFATMSPVQVFDNKNAGTGKTLTASGLVIDDNNGGNNYSVSYLDDYSGVITPKPLTVSPIDPFLYIKEGDPLPVFAFTYMGWIPGDAGNEGYTVLRDPDGAAYDPSSSSSAGTYTVTPVPSNGNYAFAFEPGTLHVNPYGPGTRAVKPVLNCVEQIGANLYIANMEYKNDNDYDVYIPIDVDNVLSGGGISLIESDEGNHQPTMFKAGGGFLKVYFDGSHLSWIINSRDGDQKVSNAANANSSSTKCKGNDKKTASVFGSATVEELDPDYLNVYPNPVVDKVHITMKDIENYKMIQLYDFAGRSHPITSIDKRTDNLEIDMAQLSAGSYFIRIIMEDTSRVVQIIKK